MTLQWVLAWWNLIFILPFGLGILYLGLYCLSGWTFGEADADAGVDHDVDAHMDADGHMSFEQGAGVESDAHVDADTDAEADADAGADAEAHADAHEAPAHGGGNSGLFAILSWIGVGKAPISLLLMIFMLSWGMIGFSANRLMIDLPIVQSIPAAVAIALIVSLLVTRSVSLLIAKYLPTNETYALRRHELLGSTAEALYPIDSTFGMACGRDAGGQPFQVACRTEPGRPPVAKGTHIKLIAYTAKERLFTIVPAESL